MKNKIEVIATQRGYVISEEGKLFNVSGKIINGSINDDGYYQSGLKICKKVKRLCFHRLQAYQKYGTSLFKKGVEVRHLNGNKLDNSWINISIGTRSENQMDIPEQVRIKRAITASSFLKKYDDELVRGFYENTKSYKKTMVEFNISSKGTLHYIINNLK